MTVLDMVFKARMTAQQKAASDTDKTGYHASLFGHPTSPPGKKALTDLANKFSTDVKTEDALTSSNFTPALIDRRLSLLHYHGHVTFLEGDPKNHGLELDDRRFTLRDVFDLAPSPST